MLVELGERKEALGKVEEALGIYRELAKKHPEAFLPDVAMSLNNLGNILSELGKRKEALAMAKEALGIYRELAKKHPEAFLPAVATSLNNLRNSLVEAGDPEAARDCFLELVNAQREYAQIANNPAPLVHSLVRLSEFLAETGSADEALAELDEAASILKPLVANSDEALKDLVGINERRVSILEELGRYPRGMGGLASSKSKKKRSERNSSLINRHKQ